jgi:hypothetical protein
MSIKVVRKEIVFHIDGVDVEKLSDVCEIARRRLDEGTKDADYTVQQIGDMKKFIARTHEIIGL